MTTLTLFYYNYVAVLKLTLNNLWLLCIPLMEPVCRIEAGAHVPQGKWALGLQDRGSTVEALLGQSQAQTEKLTTSTSCFLDFSYLKQAVMLQEGQAPCGEGCCWKELHSLSLTKPDLSANTQQQLSSQARKLHAPGKLSYWMVPKIQRSWHCLALLKLKSQEQNK